MFWVYFRKIVGLVIMGGAVFIGGVVLNVTADIDSPVQKVIVIAVAVALEIFGLWLWREDQILDKIIKFFKKLKEEFEEESTRI